MAKIITINVITRIECDIGTSMILSMHQFFGVSFSSEPKKNYKKKSFDSQYRGCSPISCSFIGMAVVGTSAGVKEDSVAWNNSKGGV